MAPVTGRLNALDLVRGAAVLGILAVNIAGFAGPMQAVYTPHALGPASPAGEAVHAATLLLFEGKMRALFSVLFGAGLLLFIERRDAAGRDGERLQLRRLGWLALLGYLHYLLWWGDILFLYALVGLLALALRSMTTPGLVAAALVAFTAWQGLGIKQSLPALQAELHAAAGTASPAQHRILARHETAVAQRTTREMAEYRSGFLDQARAKLRDQPFFPLRIVFLSMGEALPYMLIGMVLLRTGFFSGGWSRRRLLLTAALGLGLGGAATLACVLWAWRRDFPPEAMQLMINHALAFPHLVMALGYAALLVLAAPALLAGWLGKRLEAAGRMALSNYIGTSLVMTGLFYGWGLGLIGRVPVEVLPVFVLLGWMLMLGWSKPWLDRFGQGPLEWLWRCLTEWRILPNSR